MKTYAIIIGIACFPIGFSIADIPRESEDATSATQTISVPYYQTSFVRGSYDLVEARYDVNTQLSYEELESVLVQAGFSGYGLEMARAIVFYESTNKPMALNKSSNCYGLFQINMTGSMGPDRRERYGLDSNEDLFDPLINARVAYKMSDGGKNWSAWSTETRASRAIG
jgi:hypothetical protein